MPRNQPSSASVIQSGRRTTLIVCSSVLVLFGAACAPARSNAPLTTWLSHEKSVSEVLADAPSWVTRGCRAYWQDAAIRRTVVCGIGSAPGNRNRVAARETAIARARASVARSLQVTIESLVRLTEHNDEEAELDTIVHQLSSMSLRGVHLETEWQSESGEIHALVSLGLDQVQHTVRNTRALTPVQREGLAERTADAFAEMDAAFENESMMESVRDVDADES